MRLHKGLAALLVCCSFHPAYAEDTTAELDTIIVTASRSEQKLGESLAPVTLITRDDIERLQPQDTQDLLVGLPGISIVNNGGPGKSTSIFLRGTESDHVLVLIDGIKIGSATSGGASLDQIPVDQIERIAPPGTTTRMADSAIPAPRPTLAVLSEPTSSAPVRIATAGESIA